MEAFKSSHSGCRQIQIKQQNQYSLEQLGTAVAARDGQDEEGVEVRVAVGRELKGEELFKYHWRTRCKENVVRVFTVSKGKSDACGVEIIVKCEKVEVGNVQTFKNLALGQMLYLAKTIIKTSLFLSKTFGYFSIHPKLIGVNRKGEFRIWINQNFAENSRQYPISSQSQFFQSLISFLQENVKENKLFQLYLRKLIENIVCLKEVLFYEQFHCGFLRLHWIKQADRIQVKHTEKEEHFGCEGDGRPSLDKYSNQTADVTESINMESRIHQKCSKNIHLSHIPHSFNHSKNLQKKNNKQNSPQYLIQTVSSSFPKPFFDNFSLQNQAKDLKPSLNTMARLQQSIILESKLAPKQPHNMLNGYGRLCESKTVQAMILEQFQWIYE